jgi:hypothetical protein
MQGNRELRVKVEEDLELMHLLDVADGSRAGSFEEEKRLKREIM